MSKASKIIILVLCALLVLVIGVFLWFKFQVKKTQTPAPSVVAPTAVKAGTTAGSQDVGVNVEGDDYTGQDTSKERQDVTKYATVAEITQDIDYQNVQGEDMKFDLYIPQSKYKSSLDKSGPPLVIYVHGGGWVGGDKTVLDQVGAVIRLVKNGYAVASINYHLAPDYPYPTQLKDIELAIVFLKANSEKYGYNASKIGLMASSAGGHLAAQYCSMNVNQETKVDSLVLLAPATDLYSDTWSQGMKQYIKKLMNGQSAAAASPLNNIPQELPPMFIVQGTQDKIVQTSQTNAYVEKLKQAGKSVEYLVVEDAGHDFNSQTPIKPSKEEIGQQIVRFMNKEIR